ncbi:MAG: molybdopterin-dependent oxidoreductase [Spirochaetales bacterium]|nr:molybdopterin-dependent oxidoreductase [Spirochaetales bacterium]
MPERETVQTLCRMCDDRCAINVYLEDGKIVDIDGYKEHPWNRGRLCVKARAAVDMVYHPERLLKPLKRTKRGFEEIPLQQALDEIAERLLAIKDKHGARSISIWKGEAIGFAQEEDMARRFVHALGSPNYFSNDSMCYNGRYFGYRLVEGSWPVPDYENSRCVVIWGANPPHAHPNMTQMIMRARKAGAKLIVVDPRMSAIARQADLHADLKPGTDGALALGLIQQLIETQGYDREFVEHYTVGFTELAEYAKAFSPERVEEQTGVAAAVVRELARTIAAAAPRVAVYVGNGPEHHENGINNIRAVACLDAILGALDREGGNRLVEGFKANHLTLYDEIPLEHLGPIGADRFPVLYGFRQECHTMTGINTILSGEPYPIRAMILTAANPALTNPNTLKVREALGSLDLFVVRDLFMTPTAELADYVLPAASFLERVELHTHAKYQRITMTRKILKFPDVQDEYQFWHDLAHRLGIGEYFPWEDETELTRWILEPTDISLERAAAHPEGIEYTPIRYRKWEKEPFNTPSGKVEFSSQYLKDLGYPALPEYKPPAYLESPDPEYPFVLITGARKLIYYHSRFRNIKRFRTAIPGPEVELHPEDAAALGVADGDSIRITSRIGSVEVPAKIKSAVEILPGTLQMTHGWKEANVNLLTHDDRFDPISGFPLMKAVEVQVENV